MDFLQVALVFSGSTSTAPLALRMDQEFQGEVGWPDAVSALVSRDDEGALSFARASATDEDGDTFVTWTSARPPRGPVHVDYRVAVSPASARSRQFGGLRAHAGGFEGAGATFLLLPEGQSLYRSSFHWDLSRAGEGAVGASSFGFGAFERATLLEDLADAVYMAGPLGRMTFDEGAEHVHAAWLGKPAFDPLVALPWAVLARRSQRVFFGDEDPAPFGILVRVVPGIGSTWVGSGQPTSFSLLVGDEARWDRVLRFVVAHELCHHWIGLAIRFAGREGSAYWFTEGFTVHYTRALLLRSGLATPEELLEDLRARIGHYMVSPMRNLPNEVIVDKFWTEADAQRLPYERGSMYAAEVDSAIRARTGGKRSLDDVMRALFQRGRENVAKGGRSELPESAWRDLVGVELGAEGQARFDAVIGRGETAVPPADAFGPCFERVEAKFPRYDLGFDFRIAEMKDGKITIRGLRKGSAAEKAGLREGEVAEPSLIHGDLDKQAEFTVERGGKPVVIRYFPHGDEVSGFTWRRAAKVPASECGKPWERTDKP